ncbi:short-chain dehydrogenase/reductase [Amylibacter marinus]|uniref:Short-chain dehydrogenase/reductase n=1 Tax=Amylibacter marinus TaxID=1475483 RepID=A0ABQ5VUF1_9RHOB|nr:SDR family NAD(P)-dependent oxidoreductase [Amylibacter marinus]GLQ35026.1 short-chain dehydrogenase/reductase [Amylibacter marinus]
MPQSILITGCSSGIGYDAAHTLHKQGWQVFATCRQQVDCDRLRTEGLNSLVLDYADEASIKQALAQVLDQTGGTLDALYNNGAFAQPGLVQDYPRDALRAIFEVNLFGYFDLINQVLPVMFKQGHGRIINCSSVLGLGALRARGAYNSTKFAMEGLTDTLRLELRKTPIHICLIEPGPITTDIRTKAQPHFEKWIDWEKSQGRLFYEKQLIPRLYATNTTPDFGELPASAVTKKLIHALTSNRPKPRYYVTVPTYMVGIMKRLLSTRALDRVLGRM